MWVGVVVGNLIAISLLLIAFYWRRIVTFLTLMHKLRKLPHYHRTPLPIVGHAYMFPADPSKFFEFITGIMAEEQRKGHKFTKLWIGPQPVVVVHHPEVAEVLMRSSRLIEKADIYQLLDPWLGTGLLTSGGAKWRKRRRLLTPAFHFTILKDFLQVMNEHSDELVAIVEAERERGASVDLGRAVTMCALDIICETAMGEKVRAQCEHNSEYVKSLYEIMELIMTRFRDPILQSDGIFYRTGRGRRHNELLGILHNFTGAVIRRRIDEFEKQSGEGERRKKKMAFLDLLLNTTDDEGNRLSFRDIQEEVDTFMFEGHDTTAAALTWIFFQIGLHPHVQERLHREIDDVMNDDDEEKGHVTMDHLQRMPYLEQVIKESLRKYPSVPYIARQITEPCKLDGFDIPVGTEASIMCYNLHHHPDFWSDPQRFDPDRFSKDNQVGRHPFAYVPFSAGPRNCIGQKFAMQEMKVMVCKVMKRFELQSNDSESAVEKSGDLILRPTHALDISITVRGKK